MLSRWTLCNPCCSGGSQDNYTTTFFDAKTGKYLYDLNSNFDTKVNYILAIKSSFDVDDSKDTYLPGHHRNITIIPQGLYWNGQLFNPKGYFKLIAHPNTIGGTFTITYINASGTGHITTKPIAFNATATDIKNAIDPVNCKIVKDLPLTEGPIFQFWNNTWFRTPADFYVTDSTYDVSDVRKFDPKGQEVLTGDKTSIIINEDLREPIFLRTDDNINLCYNPPDNLPTGPGLSVIAFKNEVLITGEGQRVIQLPNGQYTGAGTQNYGNATFQVRITRAGQQPVTSVPISYETLYFQFMTNAALFINFPIDPSTGLFVALWGAYEIYDSKGNPIKSYVILSAGDQYAGPPIIKVEVVNDSLGLFNVVNGNWGDGYYNVGSANYNGSGTITLYGQDTPTSPLKSATGNYTPGQYINVWKALTAQVTNLISIVPTNLPNTFFIMSPSGGGPFLYGTSTVSGANIEYAGSEFFGLRGVQINPGYLEANTFMDILVNNVPSDIAEVDGNGYLTGWEGCLSQFFQNVGTRTSYRFTNTYNGNHTEYDIQWDGTTFDISVDFYTLNPDLATVRQFDMGDYKEKVPEYYLRYPGVQIFATDGAFLYLGITANSYNSAGLKVYIGKDPFDNNNKTMATGPSYTPIFKMDKSTGLIEKKSLSNSTDLLHQEYNGFTWVGDMKLGLNGHLLTSQGGALFEHDLDLNVVAFKSAFNGYNGPVAWGPPGTIWACYDPTAFVNPGLYLFEWPSMQVITHIPVNHSFLFGVVPYITYLESDSSGNVYVSATGNPFKNQQSDVNPYKSVFKFAPNGGMLWGNCNPNFNPAEHLVTIYRTDFYDFIQLSRDETQVIVNGKMKWKVKKKDIVFPITDTIKVTENVQATL